MLLLPTAIMIAEEAPETVISSFEERIERTKGSISVKPTINERILRPISP